MKNLNEIFSALIDAGFDSYGCFETEEDNIKREDFTCTRGEFSGEVIEVYYNVFTGAVVATNNFCQFPKGHPHYSPVKFDMSTIK